MAENNAEYVHLQVLLAEVEKDLTEEEAKVLELRNVRNYLLKKLGRPIEEPIKVANIPIPETEVAIHTEILPKFPRGHFYGFEKAKAGHEVLQCAGRPLTTDEIFQVLIESGYSNGSDDDRSLLSIALSRSRRLVRVAPNTFDLAHRRQKTRKTKEPKQEEAEKGKVQIEEQTQTAPETGEGIESN